MLMPHGAMFLQTLLRPPQLVFHLIHDAVQGRKYRIGLLDRHKFVVVLCPDPQLHARSVTVLRSTVTTIAVMRSKNFRTTSTFSEYFPVWRGSNGPCRPKNADLTVALSTRLIDRMLGIGRPKKAETMNSSRLAIRIESRLSTPARSYPPLKS